VQERLANPRDFGGVVDGNKVRPRAGQQQGGLASSAAGWLAGTTGAATKVRKRRWENTRGENTKRGMNGGRGGI
jgi:hypothetical protein